jgi:hypothetical protein
MCKSFVAHWATPDLAIAVLLFALTSRLWKTTHTQRLKTRYNRRAFRPEGGPPAALAAPRTALTPDTETAMSEAKDDSTQKPRLVIMSFAEITNLRD